MLLYSDWPCHYLLEQTFDFLDCAAPTNPSKKPFQKPPDHSALTLL